MQMWVQSLGEEDPPEEEMATHSSILAWETTWTEEPGGVQSVGSQSQTRLGNYRTTRRADLKDPAGILSRWGRYEKEGPGQEESSRGEEVWADKLHLREQNPQSIM